MNPDQIDQTIPDGAGGLNLRRRGLFDKVARKIEAGDDSYVFLTTTIQDATAADRLGLDSFPLMGSGAPIRQFSSATFKSQLDGLPLGGVKVVQVLSEADLAPQKGLLGVLQPGGAQKRNAKRANDIGSYLEGRGAVPLYFYLPAGQNGGQPDLGEFLGQHGPQAVMEMVTDEKPHMEAPQLSAAEHLVRIGLEATLFVSSRDDLYAHYVCQKPSAGAAGEAVEEERHFETRPVHGDKFSQWLSMRYFRETGKAAPKKALEEAERTLSGIVRHQGDPCLELAVRVARDGSEAILYDLADERWRRVRITPDGWQICENDTPRFRRYAAMEAQVVPVPGGDIARLRPFINVRSDRHWRLLLVVLVAALFPEIPHPILVIVGEHGTAKSSLLKMITRLVDPSRTPLRSEPTDIKQWVLLADHAWMICLDNLSHIPGWLSDALCRASTGDAFITRTLYSNDGDFILEFRRSIATTSIEIVAARADLLDRSVIIGLETIPKERRRREKTVFDAFDQERPALVGALLDLASGVLRELPHVEEVNLPRMADFATIGLALERVLGWPAGTFLRDLDEDASDRNQQAIEALPVGPVLLDWIVGDERPWEGTAQELLRELESRTDDKIQKLRSWPKATNVLTNQLRRLAPNLRAAGLEVRFETTRGRRLITLTAVSPEIIVATDTPSRSGSHVADDDTDDDTDDDELAIGMEHPDHDAGRHHDGRNGRDDDFRTDNSEESEYADLDLPGDGFPRVRRAPSADMNDYSDLDLPDA